MKYGPRLCDYVVLVSAYFKYIMPTILHIDRLDQILAKESRTLIGLIQTATQSIGTLQPITSVVEPRRSSLKIMALWFIM